MKFNADGCRYLFFTAFHLESCICDMAMDVTKGQHNIFVHTS
jgi:hypothetical protein